MIRVTVEILPSTDQTKRAAHQFEITNVGDGYFCELLGKKRRLGKVPDWQPNRAAGKKMPLFLLVKRAIEALGLDQEEE